MTEQKTQIVKVVADLKEGQPGFVNVMMHSKFEADRNGNNKPVLKPVAKYDGDVFDYEAPLVPSKEDPEKLVPKLALWMKPFEAPEADDKKDADSNAK